MSCSTVKTTAMSLQIGNFAVWINNDTEYEQNIAAFLKTYKTMVNQLPFFIWRDASAQHFQVRQIDYYICLLQDSMQIPCPVLS